MKIFLHTAIEKCIKDKFKLEFMQGRDIGEEYFEGDIKNMIKCIKQEI